MLKRRGSGSSKKDIELSSVAPIIKIDDAENEFITKSISPGDRNADEMTHDEAPETPKL